MPIDWQFIARQEGGQQLSAYIPASGSGKSGVTIATGFDIGQRSSAEIQRLPLPATLTIKLLPYAGLKGQRAAAALRHQPLRISKSDADSIDRFIRKSVIGRLEKAYNSSIAATDNIKRFSQLPKEAQTVITSVAFQYGNLARRTPKFWRHVIAQNWNAAVRELENFGDDFPSRRKREAAFLRRILTGAPTTS